MGRLISGSYLIHRFNFSIKMLNVREVLLPNVLENGLVRVWQVNDLYFGKLLLRGISVKTPSSLFATASISCVEF